MAEGLHKVTKQNWAGSKFQSRGMCLCVPGCGLTAAPLRQRHRHMARSSFVLKHTTWTCIPGGKTCTENTETPKQTCTYTNDAEKKLLLETLDRMQAARTQYWKEAASHWDFHGC